MRRRCGSYIIARSQDLLSRLIEPVESSQVALHTLNFRVFRVIIQGAEIIGSPYPSTPRIQTTTEE